MRPPYNLLSLWSACNSHFGKENRNKRLDVTSLLPVNPPNCSWWVALVPALTTAMHPGPGAGPCAHPGPNRPLLAPCGSWVIEDTLAPGTANGKGGGGGAGLCLKGGVGGGGSGTQKVRVPKMA